MARNYLEIRDGNIRYRVDETLVWELPLAAVRVIGEQTNDHGPYLDDYFFCFAVAADSWYAASFYADGRREFLEALESILRSKLSLKLIGGTSFDSNVLWPPHLMGRPMFTFKPAPSETWIGRLVGLTQNTQTFAPEVVAELRRASK